MIRKIQLLRKSNINRGSWIVTCMVNLNSLKLFDEKINLASKHFFPKISIWDSFTWHRAMWQKSLFSGKEFSSSIWYVINKDWAKQIKAFCTNKGKKSDFGYKTFHVIISHVREINFINLMILQLEQMKAQKSSCSACCMWTLRAKVTARISQVFVSLKIYPFAHIFTLSCGQYLSIWTVSLACRK